MTERNNSPRRYRDRGVFYGFLGVLGVSAVKKLFDFEPEHLLIIRADLTPGSARPKLAVAGIAQTGDNVTFFV